MASHSLRLPDCRRHHYPAQGRLYGDFLCGLWVTACEALGLPAGQSVQLLRAGLPAWAGERIGATPVRPSYVADDGFPAEMSVNWSGRHPELRLLFDTLSDGHDPAPTPSDATTATQLVRQIHDIFTSHSDRSVPAPLWRSLAWHPSRVLRKTYFGLYAWRLSERHTAVSQAMDRLGLAAAWDDARHWVEDIDGQREIEFLAVDHADPTNARIKVYYRSHGADIAEMHRIASVARHHDADRALAAYRTLAGDRTDAGEAALSCLAFRSGADHVVESTTYLRLADLAPTDEQAVERTAALLHAEGTDPDRLRTLAAALAPEPLSASRGVLALVSYRAVARAPARAPARQCDVTTYFRFPAHKAARTS